MNYPDWTILHVPHDSTDIPDPVRSQFVLGDDDLSLELMRMTDHCTLGLFAGSGAARRVVRAGVSRLVVDVERFVDDENEPMASRGMGVVYRTTSQLEPLRRELNATEREALLAAYYFPHHVRLRTEVSDALDRHGHCLVLDCHSFPNRPLPYELADVSQARPDICIGTDSFHTPQRLVDALRQEFNSAGWSVRIDDPFAGALVPQAVYRRDRRVAAVMIEVNRSLYLDEASGLPSQNFDRVAATLRGCCGIGLRTAYPDVA